MLVRAQKRAIGLHTALKWNVLGWRAPQDRLVQGAGSVYKKLQYVSNSTYITTYVPSWVLGDIAL